MVTDDRGGFRQLWSVRRRWALEAGAFLALCIVVSATAIAVKESRASLFPLAAIDAATSAELTSDADAPLAPLPMGAPSPAPAADQPDATPAAPTESLTDNAKEAPAAPGVVRWFNGRPVRQVRSVNMVVTAYSPDDRSCAGFADGLTATLHSVSTNAMSLVAADPRVLPYGSMLSIPGYDDGNIVPVLDCGGAIKGNRLDLLFPTHEEALKWGRKTLRVVIWEYADGGKPENPRRER